MTSLPILAIVMKGQSDYLSFSQKQTEAQKAYFAQSPQLLSWDSNPGEGDPQNPGRDGALKSTCPLDNLEVLVIKLGRQEICPKTIGSSRPACPIELSVMIDMVYYLCTPIW